MKVEVFYWNRSVVLPAGTLTVADLKHKLGVHARDLLQQQFRNDTLSLNDDQVIALVGGERFTNKNLKDAEGVDTCS
jgi:hypothetical protein